MADHASECLPERDTQNKPSLCFSVILKMFPSGSSFVVPVLGVMCIQTGISEIPLVQVQFSISKIAYMSEAAFKNCSRKKLN